MSQRVDSSSSALAESKCPFIEQPWTLIKQDTPCRGFMKVMITIASVVSTLFISVICMIVTAARGQEKAAELENKIRALTSASHSDSRVQGLNEEIQRLRAQLGKSQPDGAGMQPDDLITALSKRYPLGVESQIKDDAVLNTNNFKDIKEKLITGLQKLHTSGDLKSLKILVYHQNHLNDLEEVLNKVFDTAPKIPITVVLFDHTIDSICTRYESIFVKHKGFVTFSCTSGDSDHRRYIKTMNDKLGPAD